MERREGRVRTGRAAKVRVRKGLGRRRLERCKVEKGSKSESNGSSGVSVEGGGWFEEGECGCGRSDGMLSGLSERGGWVSRGRRCGVSS